MFLIKKRAQAAMEFLMTYGWAIMVVLAVIAALAYFGILSPSTLLPEKCTLPMMLNCQDHEVKAGSIKILIQNGAGRDMKIKSITFSGDALNNDCVDSTEKIIKSEEAEELTASSCSFKAGGTGRSKDRYKITLTYQWLDSTYIHTMEGEMLARATDSTSSSYEVCKNAEDNGLCDGLDIVFGEGYKALCCSEHSLCCS